MKYNLSNIMTYPRARGGDPNMLVRMAGEVLLSPRTRG